MSQRRGGLNLSVKMDTLTNNTVTIPFTDNDGATFEISGCKRAIDVTEITPEALFEANKGYNPTLWRQSIDRMLQHDANAKFYVTPADQYYSYERYWCAYYVAEQGINYFASFSYGACMSGGSLNPVFFHDGGVYSNRTLSRYQKDTGGRKLMRLLSEAGWRFTDSI